MAAKSPSPVASKASAIPGATTAKLVFCCSAISIKAFIIPHTVPNKPIKGAVDPIVARIVNPDCRSSASRTTATSIERSIRACAPAIITPSDR